MNLRPDDPRITAYHLGELSSDEALAVERAAAADPAVRLALRETGNLTGFLEDLMGPPGAARLRPSQREAILRSSRDADAAGKLVELPSARRSLRPWLTGLGAAAAVAFAAVLMSRLGDTPGGHGTDPGAVEMALLPKPGPAVGSGGTGVGSGGEPAPSGEAVAAAPVAPPTEVARHLRQGPLPDATRLPATTDQAAFDSAGRIRLPVVIGTASGTWVRRWIEEKNELPPARAVRVEEMVNGVTLPAPVRQGDLSLGLHRLDWGGARWVGVQLVAGDRDVAGLVVRSVSDAPRRVVGSFGLHDDEALPTTLPAGSATLVLLEFAEGADTGRVEVEIGGVVETHELADEGRTGDPAVSHAVATAIFGRWLRGEAPLARLNEVLDFAAAATADPVHEDDRRLMRRAIELAE